MKIYDYLDTRVDPKTLRKVNICLMLDDEGEPFIKFEYIDENNKVDLFSTTEEIKGIKVFASSITRIIRDEFEKDFEDIRPIIYDDATHYYKYKFSKDKKIPQGFDINTIYSENVLLGLVIEPKKSELLLKTEKLNILLALVKKITQNLNEKEYNCELDTEPKHTHKLTQ